ncbi:MAG TPA: protein translocase subunit SecD, partial [Gemmatimonadaceae bacterium]|nr:protein translocase subunit SecD [Gemmatimonadaceae bacterium]
PPFQVVRMSNLKSRLAIIGVLIVASVFALLPRDVEQRQRRPDGTFFDTVVKRVPLKRGLDLQGGMHMTLEVDESKRPVVDKKEAITKALTVVRNRIEGFGVSEPVIQLAGDDRIIVELPGIDDRERAMSVVQDQAYLEFKIVDESRSLERVLPRLDQIARAQGGAAAGTGAAPAAQPAPKSGLEGLLSASDSAGADSAKVVASADTAAAAIDSAKLTTGGPFSSLLQQGGMPGEYYVAAANESRLATYLATPAIQQALPPGKQMLLSSDTTRIANELYRAVYVVDSRPIITGEYITDAQPQQDPLEGTLVQFSLNNEGGRRFRTETGRNIQKNMAIILDGRVMGRPPTIQSAIGTRGQITMGGRELQAAQDLALVLRAGALPTPLKVAEIRTIGPSLGADAIRRGVQSGLLGIALVIVIMVAYYRFSGVLAVGGLAFYALTTLAFLAAFDATLTLPGIAGFILSIGMAVDANFLQFERIREELARGKTPRLAVDEGFRNSWSAIVDTHVTTALTAAVLYQYGTGPVKGFAVTLIAGVASSMVSAVFVVRTLFLVWLSRTRGNKALSI